MARQHELLGDTTLEAWTTCRALSKMNQYIFFYAHKSDFLL